MSTLPAYITAKTAKVLGLYPPVGGGPAGGQSHVCFGLVLAGPLSQVWLQSGALVFPGLGTHDPGCTYHKAS